MARPSTIIMLAIIITSVVILLVAYQAAVLVRKGLREKDNNKEKKLATELAIQQICSHYTFYKDRCKNVLGSANSTNILPLIKIILQSAVDVVEKAISQLQTSTDPQVARCFQVCQPFLDTSMYYLRRTLARTDAFQVDNFRIVMDDVKTWLSAATTHQTTCLITLKELAEPIDGQTKIKETLQPSYELAENGFGLLNQLSQEIKPNEVKGNLVSTMAGPNPRVTVTVAQDGSGNFTTINQALEHAPPCSNTTYAIHIRKGVYQEYVKVQSYMCNVLLIGEGSKLTRIRGNRTAELNNGTYHSATVTILGENVLCRGLAIENYAGRNVDQAVALLVVGDNTVIYNCTITGYQDTLYVHSNRQVYSKCLIEGTVDFIFGHGKVLIEDCNLRALEPREKQQCVFTAQGGATEHDDNQAIVIQKSNFIVDPTWTYLPECLVGSCPYQVYLGRPWDQFSTTTIMLCHIDFEINEKGWLPWNDNNMSSLDNVKYIEYKNTGLGAHEPPSRDKRCKGCKVTENDNDVAKYLDGTYFDHFWRTNPWFSDEHFD